MAPTSAVCTLSLFKIKLLITFTLVGKPLDEGNKVGPIYIECGGDVDTVNIDKSTCQKWLQLLHCVRCHAAAQMPVELHLSK